MTQDTSLPQTSQSDDVSPGSQSPPPSFPDPSTSVSPQVVAAHEVHVEGDIQSVPKETVGLGQDVPLSGAPAQEPAAVVTQSVPGPSVTPAPSSTPNLQPDNDDSSSAVNKNLLENSAEAQPAEQDGESSDDKSPLDILEEILAGAEAEKKQVDEEKAKKDQEEAAFQAQLDAKKAEYQVQADEKLRESQDVVAEAQQQREAIDRELTEQGKIEPQTAQNDDSTQIRQLEHIKPE